MALKLQLGLGMLFSPRTTVTLVCDLLKAAALNGELLPISDFYL